MDIIYSDLNPDCKLMNDGAASTVLFIAQSLIPIRGDLCIWIRDWKERFGDKETRPHFKVFISFHSRSNIISKNSYKLFTS
jgi:hypothetical protein